MRTNTTVWNFLCNYINIYPNGVCIERKDIVLEFRRYLGLPERQQKYSTIDTYLMLLRRIRVIETAGYGKYKKIQAIPKELTNKKAREIAVGAKWKTWFMELKDRV